MLNKQNDDLKKFSLLQIEFLASEAKEFARKINDI